jgi:hypothetical protein
MLVMVLTGCGAGKSEKPVPLGSFEVKVGRTELELPAAGGLELPVEVVWTQPPTAEVTLSAQMEPEQSGIKASVHPVTLGSSGGMATLILQADGNATGRHQVRIQGKSGPRTHEVTLPILVVR